MTVDVSVDAGVLEFVDTVERRRCLFRSPEALSYADAPQEQFVFPVDRAVTVDASTLTLDALVSAFVRDGDGNHIDTVDHNRRHEYEEGTYLVELSAAMKLYVRVEGRLVVDTDGPSTILETEGGNIAVGARSHHREPIGTIRTSPDPEDLMTAVSALSSALKTTSPERSFPTLRGHPPDISIEPRKDGVEIPSAITPPDTDVRIEVPPSRRYIYPIASLAYYFGATVVPGSEPRLIAGDDEFDLDEPHGFERSVERTLKKTFFLDCIVRTEGYYPVDLVEREALENTLARDDRLPRLDFESLYHAPLTERIATYQNVPWSAVVDHIPAWKVTTHLSPTGENAELLPFLVDDLAVIRLPEGESMSVEQAQTNSITRSMADGGDFTRSVSVRSSGETTEGPAIVDPAETDAVEQVWADDRAPVGATKASVAAYRNRLDHTRSSEIGVTVVCNDDEMAEEGNVATSVYGEGSEVPFDVRSYTSLSTDALKAVLETDRDFLHYIGHIEEDGFECTDGRLDAWDLDHVGIDAFLLNACTSYEQGMALLEAGAVGGVVTLADVLNSGATRVGKSMVRLLDAGFPLHGALDIASEESFVGGQYIVVGDGSLDLVQHNGTPTLIEADPIEDETYDVKFKGYPTRRADMGILSQNRIFGNEKHYLAFGRGLSATATKDQLIDYKNDYLPFVPIKMNNELVWDSL